MKTREDLIREYVESEHYSRGEWSVHLSRCSEFIEQCFQNSIAISGMEALLHFNKATMPMIDFIADYSEIFRSTSWEDIILRSYHSSRQFISELPHCENLYVDFTLVTYAEWTTEDRFRW